MTQQFLALWMLGTVLGLLATPTLGQSVGWGLIVALAGGAVLATGRANPPRAFKRAVLTTAVIGLLLVLGTYYTSR